MNGRIPFLIAILASAAAGCIQPVDNVTGNVPAVAGSSEGPPLPFPFTQADVDAAMTKQCAYGSALCYQLCGSPSCANQDNTIPNEVATVPAMLPDGGWTTDACEVVRAQSARIRLHACAQCHEQTPGFSSFNFVLDDMALVTKLPNTVQVPLVIPGSPETSYFLQRMELGLSGGTTGMPPAPSLAANLVSPSIANTIVRPTPEDMSVMYAWILNCVPGADGGAYATSYYGGNYAPDASILNATGAPSSGLDAGSATAPGATSFPDADAGVAPVVDSGATGVVPPARGGRGGARTPVDAGPG
jgi:hypothetical protein